MALRQLQFFDLEFSHSSAFLFARIYNFYTIEATCKHHHGTIVACSCEEKHQKQPLVHSLASLTSEASKAYGYSAQDVLDTCQALYERHKIVSYPRTDCRYLPESQHAHAASIVQTIKDIYPHESIFQKVDLSIKSPTWNDKKITAHHGIIPTSKAIDRKQLNDKEANIYFLIVNSYMMQFLEEYIYRLTLITLELDGEVFTAKGNAIINKGWREASSGKEEEDAIPTAEKNLPLVERDDDVVCINVMRKDQKTSPPSRYTEGTLIQAMENIHRYTDNDVLKKLLKDGDGIGTPATRASIITDLKKRNFLETKNKHIVSTTLGKAMIKQLPQSITSAELTAAYEAELQKIEDGVLSVNDFLHAQVSFLKKQIEISRTTKIVMPTEPIASTPQKKITSHKRTKKS